MVQFVSNYIPSGKPTKSFQDMVKEAQNKSQKTIKTASVEEDTDEQEAEAQEKKIAAKKSDVKVAKHKEEKNKKKEKDEAESSGQPEAEAKLNNNPKVEKDAGSEDKSEKEASGSNEDDKAESSGQLEVEPLHQKGESTDAGNLPKKDKEESNDEVEAHTMTRFVKVSKLNSENRNMLLEYWKNLYPAEYAEAMVKDE